jgi:hypothetical protein
MRESESPQPTNLKAFRVRLSFLTLRDRQFRGGRPEALSADDGERLPESDHNRRRIRVKSDAMAVSQSLESTRAEPKPETEPVEKALILRGESKRCDSVRDDQVPRAGLEPIVGTA